MAVSSATALDERLSAFLHNFPTPLHYTQPESWCQPWVFWSKDEGGSQITNNSSSCSSADLQPPPVPYNNIISAFSKLRSFYRWNCIVQLWVPVTINGRNLLSTSRQPFTLGHLYNDILKKYRLRSMKYHFNIDDDVNNQLQLHIQEDEDEGSPIILNGGPAAAFLNRMLNLVRLKDYKQGSPLARYALEGGLEKSVMLPICYPSQTSSCIGVVEITSNCYYYVYLEDMKRALEEVGLSICPLQEHIPYKTIHALKHARDEIEAALKILCKSHKLSLAQVWIPYANENHVPFSSSLEDTQIKCMRALKLFGHVNEDRKKNIDDIKEYSHTCDAGYLFEGNKPVEMTLQDYKPRLCQNMKKWIDKMLGRYTACEFLGVAICLRSIDTGDLDYAFEFIWYNTKNNVIFLEALLLRLKKSLPSFRFSSGTELGDELDFHVINDPLDDNDEVSDELESKGDAKNTTVKEVESLKIFQGKKSSPLAMALKAGKKPTVMDSSSAKWKTAPKQLPQELIEGQFRNTMKEAAENLNVSLSTLKRKCKEYHIYEWQGPNVVKKNKVNASSNNQSKRNEEGNGAIQEPSVVNRNENTLTIKAEFAGDMIKFDLHTSQASFVSVQKEIGNKFNLTPRTYKLKYLDKDKDLILLTSDQDMSDCIKFFTNLGQTVVRLCVLPSP